MIRIQLISLEQVEPGTRLAAPVSDAAGNILLGEGAVLTQAVVGSLLKRGITHVSVGEEETISEEALAAKKKEIIGRLDKLFRKHDADPLMARLRQVVQEYRLEALP